MPLTEFSCYLHMNRDACMLKIIGEDEVREHRNKKNFDGRICCRCGSVKTGKNWFGHDSWYSHSCDKKNCTKYFCSKCWQEDYRKLPDSHNNIIKGLANSRTGNLDRSSESGKSIIDQAVVSKVLKIEDLNIKMNNFEWYIDMENDMYKKIDTKGSCLRIIRAGLLKYYIWSFHTYKKIDINTFICIGYDRNRNNIDFVWVIPNDRELITSESINITKGYSGSKYGKFKVDAKPYNDAYHSLMEFLKDKKYFGIEDIKKWLNDGR